MALTTSVPALTIGPTGVVAPLEADVLAGRLADINTAFGGGLNVDPNNLGTPQAQLASSEAAAIADKNDQIRYYVTQVDPQYAQGRMQDAIGRIYFLSRDPARPTTVQCACNGLPGTIIPAGALARSTLDDNLYICTLAGAIPSTGTITLPFACAVTGPVPCPTGSFDRPYQAIVGWDSITNAADGALGNNVEGRTAFEARRAASVAVNAQGTLAAVRGAVLSVPNVLDAYVTENDDSAPVTIGGVTLPPNSLYVSVVGGDPTAIAQAIATKKAPGCLTSGNTTVQVQDTSYAPPYPSQSISLQVATPTPVFVTATIINTPAVPADAQTQAQVAIIAAFAGEDGGPRARIGGTILASRYYAAVAALGPWAQIVSIQVGQTVANAFQTTLRIDQEPVASADTISLAFA